MHSNHNSKCHPAASEIQADQFQPDAPAPYHFWFWKGRIALYAILRALRLNRGDQVIVGGYTCVVVPAAVQFAGAEPLYVDIDPASYNLTLDGIKGAWAQNRRIRVVIVQHTYGLPADTASIMAWARRNNVIVIEDGCHCLGSRYRDAREVWRDVGTLGDASFFSSQWSKPVSTGLGGWVSTNDPKLALALETFHRRECVSPSVFEWTLLALQVLGRRAFSSRSYWFALDAYRALARVGLCIGSSVDQELQGTMPRAYAKRMSGFQHWLLGRRLAKAHPLIDHRRRLTEIYEEGLMAAGLPVLAVPHYADPVFLRYPVRVANKGEVLEKARQRRFEIGDWFDHPLHPKESDARAFGYTEGMCPEGERAAEQVINLPLHGGISRERAQDILSFLVGAGAFDLSQCRTRVSVAAIAAPKPSI